jgi:hypothetical protein
VRLRNDFPDFTLKASIIKNLNTPAKIRQALRLYDYVTVPMDKNDDDEFLRDLPEKDRIILFGNANCAYTCPARTCYVGFSQKIQGKPVSSRCSKKTLPRLDLGQVWFDVSKLGGLGYTFFKMIPPVTSESIDPALLYRWKKKGAARSLFRKKPGAWLCSYPKCGRSWLRFIIAHYLKLSYDLELEIDFHSIFWLLPNEGENSLKGLGGYRYADDPRFPLLVSSHATYREGWLGEAPVIFLLRSIPDVVVSDYFQTTRLLKAYHGTLKEFIRDPQGGLHRYLRYLSSWADFIRRGQAQVVRYEALHARTAEVAAGVLSFLNIPVDQGLLAEAIRRSTFEAMQEIEKARGIAGHEYHFEDPEARRVRKGRVNGYREYLGEDDLGFIKKICEQYPLIDEDLISCP